MAGTAHAEVFAPPLETADKKNLVGLSREALEAQIVACGEPAFRARQLWQWIYSKGVTDFDQMTSLSKAFRARLAESFVVRRPDVVQDLQSSDGTRKWLLRFTDGQEVETVYIPEEDRGTLCVSQPGRLYPDLPLLQYGHAATGPQPRAR